MTKINKDMTFKEALDIAGQEGAIIMGNYGLHCIGCHIAATEKIHEGCAAHGLSDDDCDKMIDEINEKIKEFDKNMEGSEVDESSDSGSDDSGDDGE